MQSHNKLNDITQLLAIDIQLEIVIASHTVIKGNNGRLRKYAMAMEVLIANNLPGDADTPF